MRGMSIAERLAAQEAVEFGQTRMQGCWFDSRSSPPLPFGWVTVYDDDRPAPDVDACLATCFAHWGAEPDGRLYRDHIRRVVVRVADCVFT